MTKRKCRLCHEHDEAIDDTISACPLFSKEQYIQRQECVLEYTTKEIRVKLDNDHWYELILKSVVDPRVTTGLTYEQRGLRPKFLF
jgi:hypothetical protein